MDSDIIKSDVVAPICGRDKDMLMLVIELLPDGHVLLANGKLRKVDHLKRKKLKHVRFVAHTDCRTALKLRNGEKVSNSEVRRALSDFEQPHFSE